jgi:hypothetical protein
VVAITLRLSGSYGVKTGEGEELLVEYEDCTEDGVNAREAVRCEGGDTSELGCAALLKTGGDDMTGGGGGAEM